MYLLTASLNTAFDDAVQNREPVGVVNEEREVLGRRVALLWQKTAENDDAAESSLLRTTP